LKGGCSCVFRHNFLTMSDTHGNVAGTALRQFGANVVDYTGQLIAVPADTQRVTGGHFVENLVPFSEDWTNAYWTTYTSGGGTITVSADKKSITFDAPVGARAFINLSPGISGDVMLQVSQVKNSSGVVHNATLYMGSVHVATADVTGVVAFRADPLGGQIRFGLGCNGVDTIAHNMSMTLPSLVNVTGKPASYVPPYVPRLTAAPASQWFDNTSSLTVDPVTHIVTDTGVSQPLHPSRTYLGEKLYLSVVKYTTATVVPVGGSMYDAGRWYTSANGGTTSGVSLLADTGVTDWVDNGLYNPEFGHLLERQSTNRHPSPQDQSALTGWTAGTTVIANNVNLTSAGAYHYGEINGLTIGTSYTGKIRMRSLDGKAQVGLSFYNGATYQALKCMLTTAYQDFEIPNVTIAGAPVIFGLDNRAAAPQQGDGTTTGTIDVEFAQVESGSTSTSFINGTRYEEGGMVAYPTAAPAFAGKGFPQAAGTLLASMVAQHDLSAHGNTNDALITTDTNWDAILGQGWTQGIFSSDSRTNNSLWMSTPYLRGETVEFTTQWDDSVPQFRVGYRIADRGMAWTYSVYQPYDGAFTDTGFFKALAAGTLGWAIRNWIVWDRQLTDAEMAGVITK